MDSVTDRAGAARQALLERRLRGGGGSARAVVPAREAGAAIPLSPVQRGFWIVDRFLDSNALFGAHQAVWLRGDLDVAALRTAFDDLVARHEILRTTFPAETRPGGTQVVHPPGPAAFEAAEASDAAEALERAKVEVHRPFDLERGPLLRVLLLGVEVKSWLLVVNMHHMLTDEWSFQVLARELGALYAARRRGGPPARPGLPDLPLQYGDYAAWQSRRAAARRDEQLAYWRRAMDGIPAILDLPTDRPRPPEPSYRGAQAKRALSAELTAKIHALAAAHGATMFTTILTAFAGTLHRVTGQERFAVGSLLTGRNRVELEPLIGLFANTLPLPMDLTGDPDFAEALQRANRALVGALDHQDVTFDQIVAELRLEREPSRNPLYQVLVQYLDGEECWSLPGLAAERAELDADLEKADLTLLATGTADHLVLELSYARDLFDAGTAERLLERLETVLTHVTAEPDVPLSRIEVLSADERDLVVRRWNDTAAPYPVDKCLHELFEDQVRRTPDAVAVVDAEGREVGFAELDERAERLARVLTAAGVGPERFVGVLVDHCVDLFVSLLGVMKAGGAYLPLDPGHPANRLEFMLSDTKAEVLVTVERLRGRVPAAFTGRVVCAGEDAPPAPRRTACADNLIYAMYTSGSTGLPKGVMITHRQLNNYLWWAIDGYGLDGAAGAPMVGSIAFDLSIPNFFLPLIGGKSVTLVPGGDDVMALAELLSRPGDFSLLKITPGHLDALRGVLGRDQVTSVRTFVVGADEVRPETVAAWRQVAPGARIIDEYGPTETVVGCSVYVIGDDFDPSRPISIGRPIANMRMYALDRHLNPVPPGTVGELFIGGDGVARGYLNRVALTAERFLPDPFVDLPGARMYRTGDLIRFRPDGNMDFLGRIDNQVKVRGYRIELGEIEARLLLHPGVAQGVVAVHETGPGRRQLTGYVVAAAGHEPDPAGLRAFLAEALPEYMVPATFVILPTMPLTTAGKVDRKLLPPPGRAAVAHGVPSTPAQRLLAGVWARTLGVAEVGVHDNFFDLGGDSIQAIRLCADARRLGLQLSPRDVLRHQTIAELAARVEEAARPVRAEPFALSGLGRDQVGRQDAEDAFRLSPLQSGMLFHALNRPGDYSGVDEYLITGPLDPGLFAAAWQRVIARHPALRSTFVWEGLPHPVQVVLRGVQAPFAEAGVEEEVRLGDGLPYRIVVVREGAERHRLRWACHHIVLDGWSKSAVLAEVFAVYEALCEGREPELPEPVPFAAHAAWLAGLDGAADARFWRRELAGVSAPTPLPGRPGGTGAGRQAAVLDERLVADLTGIARGGRMTLNAVLLGVWALLLGRATGTDDVVFGVTLSGRSAPVPGIDRMVGMLMNTVPARIRLQEDATAADWLAAVHLRQVELRGHEHSSLVDIRRHSDIPGDLPIFESVFVYDAGGFADPPSAAGLTIRQSADEGGNDLPLTVTVDTGPDGRVTLALLHRRERLGDASARALLDEYLRLLRAVAAAPGAPLRELADPGVAAERVLTRIWAEVLQVDHVGPEDDFFELGGDSILSVHIVGRARTHGLTFTPRQLLQHRTVAALLAAGLAEAPPAPPAAELSGLRPEELERFSGEEDVLRLSPLQTGMLVGTLAAEGRDPYFRQWSYELEGDLDAGAFARAWQWVIDRHPALRSRIVWEGLSHPVQVVGRHSPVMPERWDARRTGTAALDDLLAEDRERGFDLRAGVPMRLMLVRTGERSHRLVWSAHHILLDGWSHVLVMREVFDAYEALREGRAPSAPAAVPYREFIASLGRRPDGAGYWRRAMDGFAEATPVPLRGAGPRGAGVVATTLPFGLKAAAAAHGVTTATIAEAAWALLLARRSGQRRVTFGVTVSGRLADVPGIERMVGMLLNTLPSAVEVSGTVGAWLRRVHESRLARSEHEHDALVDIRRWAGLPAGRPLYETRFVYAGTEHEEAGGERAGLRITDVTVVDGELDSPLVLALSTGEVTQVQLRYDVPGYDGQVAERLLGEYVRTLEELVAAAPDTPVMEPEAREPWQVLARIWREVLGVAEVGRHDDFFDLGGDSMLVFQVVSRARQEGIELTVRQLLRHRTIAELLDGAPEPARPAAPADSAPLTPAIRRLLALDVSRCNQAALLLWREPPDPARLERALRALVAHHETLRLRLRDGRLRRSEAADHPILREVTDLEAAAEEVNAAVDPVDGPLIQAALVPGEARTLIVVHHLAIDTVSWSVLLDDLATAYRGDKLAPVTTTYLEWARRLADRTGTPRHAEELAYWSAALPVTAADLPLDHPDGENTEARERVYRSVLSARATGALLRRRVDEALLSCVAAALSRWTGSPDVLIDVESHGRADLFEEVDLSRTLGWFTAAYPLHVHADDPDLGARLRAVPHHGIGYGLALPDLEGRARAQVSFTYHGRRGDRPGALFTVADEAPGRVRQGVRAHRLAVSAAVADGRLVVEWAYSSGLHEESTIAELAGCCLRELEVLAECPPMDAALPAPRRLYPGSPALLLPMARHGVPGVGVAVIEEGGRVRAWGQGVTGERPARDVGARTRFQACSVSKHVTTLAVLRLVQEGRLELEEDVHAYLSAWRLPGGGATVRDLLDHRAGLNGFGHPGYPRHARLPGPAEVLNGVPPANTPAVVRERAPGAFRYTGGGFSVLQQVVTDVTGMPFEAAMRELVLEPLGMEHSGYEAQPPTALGHLSDGTVVDGGWRVFPELAASGLWSTPQDLAKAELEIFKAASGLKTAFLTREMAEVMLTPRGGAYGAGTAIDGRWFGHPGDRHSYQCFTAVNRDTGDGLVIMANLGGEPAFVADVLHELALPIRYAIEEEGGHG
ncbi:amino acid adenylation domain-containing protein [Nonomuraea indica]|uniref:Amino acid adenylation domain-containing protein n=1 Tax=Nonomuraea indica TaxID=1581193 RepID=A0ABW8ADV8_9ACTN